MTRATYRYEHARIGRKIINFDSGGYGICAWDTCDRDATSLHQVRTHEHDSLTSCEAVDAGRSQGGRHMWYAFCSERHKLYWVASSGEEARRTQDRYGGRVSGMLPAGYRRTVL